MAAAQLKAFLNRLAIGSSTNVSTPAVSAVSEAPIRAVSENVLPDTLYESDASAQTARDSSADNICHSVANVSLVQTVYRKERYRIRRLASACKRALEAEQRRLEGGHDASQPSIVADIASLEQAIQCLDLILLEWLSPSAGACEADVEVCDLFWAEIWPTVRDASLRVLCEMPLWMSLVVEIDAVYRALYADADNANAADFVEGVHSQLQSREARTSLSRALSELDSTSDALFASFMQHVPSPAYQSTPSVARSYFSTDSGDGRDLRTHRQELPIPTAAAVIPPAYTAKIASNDAVRLVDAEVQVWLEFVLSALPFKYRLSVAERNALTCRDASACVLTDLDRVDSWSPAPTGTHSRLTPCAMTMLGTPRDEFTSPTPARYHSTTLYQSPPVYLVA